MSILTSLPHSTSLPPPSTEFVIQYEDLLHQPDVWVNLTEVAGSGTTARLQLSPYVYYSFRILAQNHVGFSQPSHPSRQYRTNPAGETPSPPPPPSLITMVTVPQETQSTQVVFQVWIFGPGSG